MQAHSAQPLCCATRHGLSVGFCLHSQLAQERERERFEERRKAQEAALLLQKAAGGYGGGSGPLRGVDGRPITDLNQARRERCAISH